MTAGRGRIAFHGEPGAHAHIACREVYPEYDAVPFTSFGRAFEALADSVVDLVMVPVENSTAGRVADIHHLLPDSDLHIIGEHFLRVRHCLLAPDGAGLDTLATAHSHPQALAQCRRSLLELGLTPVMSDNTATAARDVARSKDPSRAAVASRLAAEIFRLTVLRQDLEDRPDNMTRFAILAREQLTAAAGSGPIMTTVVFETSNRQAGLFKALGGFATNGIGVTRLENCTTDGRFVTTRFLVDIEGHPGERPVDEALRELAFHAEYRILGVYRASPIRERLRFATETPALSGSHRGKDASP